MASTFANEISQLGPNIGRSFSVAALQSGPLILLHALDSAFAFILVLLLLYFLVKKGLSTTAAAKSGLPGETYSIPIFDGAGLARMGADQGDTIGLGWGTSTQSGFRSGYRPGGPSGYADYTGSLNSSSFGNREPPFFSEVSNDNLRSEDRQHSAVIALSKINAERARRRPDDPYEPLPWGPFWSEWQKDNADPYMSTIDYENRRGTRSGLVEGPAFLSSGRNGMAEGPGFLDR